MSKVLVQSSIAGQCSVTEIWTNVSVPTKALEGQDRTGGQGHQTATASALHLPCTAVACSRQFYYSVDWHALLPSLHCSVLDKVNPACKDALLKQQQLRLRGLGYCRTK